MNAKPTNKDLARLIELVHHRWNVFILAELYERSGAKFVTLAHALDAGRGSLSTSLKHLAELGLVAKNPGYGHPMRPEYVLTEAGLEIGERCLALARILREQGDSDLAFRKWTLPLVAAIGTEVRRFNEVKNELPGATPRAVTMGLKGLLARQWARRTLVDSYPPTAGYSLLPKGRVVHSCIGG